MGPTDGADQTRPSSRVGRRSRLEDEEAVDAFLTAYANGNSINDAARASGIAPRTVKGWLRAAREVRRRGPHGPEDERLLHFLHRFTRARALSMVQLVAWIVAAAEKDWRAAAWIAERRDRKRWGRRNAIDNQTSKPVKIDFGQFKSVEEMYASALANPDPAVVEATVDYDRKRRAEIAARRHALTEQRSASNGEGTTKTTRQGDRRDG